MKNENKIFKFIANKFSYKIETESEFYKDIMYAKQQLTTNGSNEDDLFLIINNDALYGIQQMLQFELSRTSTKYPKSKSIGQLEGITILYNNLLKATFLIDIKTDKKLLKFLTKNTLGNFAIIKNPNQLNQLNENL